MDFSALMNVLGMTASWGLYYVLTDAALTVFSPLTLGFIIRCLAFILQLFLLSKKRMIIQVFMVGKMWIPLVVATVLGFTTNLLTFVGMEITSAINAAIISRMDLVFTLLVSVLFLKYRFTGADFLGMVLMVAGVMVVMRVNVFAFNPSLGDLIILLTAAILTANSFFIKWIIHRDGKSISNEVTAFYNNFISGILFLLLMIIFGEKFSITSLNAMKPADLWALIGGGVTQFLIYLFYYRCLDRLPVWQVRIFLLLIPVFSTIFGSILYKDLISPFQILGIILVISGGYLIIKRQRETGSLHSC